jgi:hypothetical protein
MRLVRWQRLSILLDITEHEVGYMGSAFLLASSIESFQ